MINFTHNEEVSVIHQDYIRSEQTFMVNIRKVENPFKQTLLSKIIIVKDINLKF